MAFFPRFTIFCALPLLSCRSESIGVDSFAGSPDLIGLAQDIGVAGDVIISAPEDIARWQPPADQAGPPSQHALLCDGVDDEVVVDLGPWLQHPAAFTLEFWFRPDHMDQIWPPEYLMSSSPSLNPVAVDIWDINANRGITATMTQSNDRAECGGYFGFGNPFTPAANIWHHFAIQFSPLGHELFLTDVYLDGKLRPKRLQQTGTSRCFGLTRFLICHGSESPQPVPGSPFHGAIDEMRVSTVARYGPDFLPGDPTVDDVTALLLRFEALPLVDDGPHTLTVTTRGNPQLTGDVHPR